MDQQIVPYRPQEIVPYRASRHHALGLFVDDAYIRTAEGASMFVLQWRMLTIPDRRREDHKGTRKRVRHGL
jgi:hypothetical protein